MNEVLPVGAKAKCAMCGEPITFVGPYWDHDGEIKPRHPATPTPWGTKETEEQVESAVIKHLVDAWNEYQKLPERHPTDKQEFMHAIHAAQNIVLARMALRLTYQMEASQMEAKAGSVCH